MNIGSIRVWVAGLVLAAATARAELSDGLYAEFQTSLGTFTCQLEMDRAPRTVANFVGLATGERAWLAADGRIRNTPFYDGLLFHRVVAGFVIQSGSPNGEGKDGPGYAVSDELNTGLTHDAAGVLSMANSGPNSNGSQFFITATATPALNNVHSVFGRVIEGLGVVTAINQVSTDTNERPLTPVILHHVIIHRLGAAAQAFDVTAHDLPVVTGLRAGLRAAGAGIFNVEFPREPYSAYRLYDSLDLHTWTGHDLGIETAAARPDGIRLDINGQAKGFLSLARVKYAASTRAPPVVTGRTLSLIFDGDTKPLVIVFDASGGGTYQYYENVGTVKEYTWVQDPYRGLLWPIYFSALPPMTLRLDFADDSGGTLSGKYYTGPSSSFDISGTFSISAE